MHKAERLVNLTVALLEARRPLTFAEIRRSLRAYDQGDAESARRMFERDKDDLRKLGVPVETRALDAFETEIGYIVDRAAYALPDIDLTAAEIAALAVALEMTGEQRARVGLAKLAARAPDPAVIETPLPATIDLGADQVDALADALVARQTVRFRYRRADGDERERTVDPYAVLSRRGHWYVVGRDHEREDVRAYRLDRIRSRVKGVGEPASYEVPEDLDAVAHVRGPDQEVTDVDVAIAPTHAWQAQARGGEAIGESGGWPVYRLHGVPPRRTLSWVLSLGRHAEVVAPAELRDAADAHLRSLLDAAS